MYAKVTGNKRPKTRRRTDTLHYLAAKRLVTTPGTCECDVVLRLRLEVFDFYVVVQHRLDLILVGDELVLENHL